MKKQVLIADADEQFRNELLTALDGDEFEVIGVAADGEEALRLLQTKQAEILVMDLLLPIIDGLTVLAHIHSIWNRPKVLITSAFISEYVAMSAVRLGAQQLLLKPCSIDRVLQTMHRMENADTKGSALFWENGKQDLALLVTNVLHQIGVPANVKGHNYLREVILLAVMDMDLVNSISSVLYPQVARTFQTTPSCIERGIRRAIEIAWNRGDLSTLERFFGYTISNTKGKPTNSEFVAIVADHIHLRLKENADQLK